jgi:hypothetical protein
MINGRDVMYLKIIPITGKQYESVFIKKSLDTKSVEFRNNCFQFLHKCESTFAEMNPFDKVRLMIEHDLSIVENLHKPSGVTYIIARAYWIDNNGKKFRKFIKNMGAMEKVYVNGEIPSFKREEVEFTINQMMLEQYRKDYPD